MLSSASLEVRSTADNSLWKKDYDSRAEKFLSDCRFFPARVSAFDSFVM
jgi:hypothetical protein